MLRIDVQETGWHPARRGAYLRTVRRATNRRPDATGAPASAWRSRASWRLDGWSRLLVNSTPASVPPSLPRSFARTGDAVRHLTGPGRDRRAGAPVDSSGGSQPGGPRLRAPHGRAREALLARGGRPPAALFLDSRHWPLDLAALRACSEARGEGVAQPGAGDRAQLGDRRATGGLAAAGRRAPFYGFARGAGAAGCARADRVARDRPPVVAPGVLVAEESASISR